MMTEGYALSASVVQYKNAQETLCCLESLREKEGSALAVYLVDNASPDGALDTLRAEGVPPGVQLLAQEKNLGYGAGHNRVLPLLGSRYHAVVNPDIVLQDNAITQMAQWMEAHPDVAITTPRLVFPDGRPQLVAKRRPAVLPLLARQLGWQVLKPYEDHYLMLDEDLSQPIDVAFCSGSFFVIRTDVFREIGGFDEDYFMYVEDADITQKALAKGRAVYLPQVTVTHAWHRDAHRKPRQFLWQLKSMLRYFRKWGFKWS